MIRGEVDLYLATKDDLFVVKTNQSTNGFHHTYIDKSYLELQKVSSTDQHAEFSIDESNLFLNENAIRKPFYLREEHVESTIPMYFNVENLNEIAIFRKVRYRLEVTIPYKTQGTHLVKMKSL